MGVAGSTYGGERGACRILMGKPEGKRSLERTKSIWEDYENGSSGSGMGGMDWIDLAQVWDRWRALVNAVKCGEFLDYPSTVCLLKKDSALWSEYVSQKISRILSSLKFQYRVHKSPPFVTVLSRFCPTFCSLVMNIILFFSAFACRPSSLLAINAVFMFLFIVHSFHPDCLLSSYVCICSPMKLI